jgi:peptide/nickel transport system substrate-binding protein
VTTRALELRKGSADACINALTADMVTVLQHDPSVEVQREPGTIYAYIALNLRDPILRDVRVRQALAFAVDREPLIHNLWRDQARVAPSILPPQSWAFDPDVATYQHNPARAAKLLDEAGYPLRHGERFHLTMKTSSEESSRLMAAVLQQQLREVGIVLDIRSFEFATFFADVTKGAFQVYSLRWIGGNQDPDIFETFHSSRMPPKGANRGFYSNPRVDALIDAARVEPDQGKRKAIYSELQRILAVELPYIHLWYFDNVLVHTRRAQHLTVSPSGSYDFLRAATLE